MPVNEMDTALTDKALELRVGGAAAAVRTWRSPAAASGTVAHRTWRIDNVSAGTTLQIETDQPPGLPSGAAFYVGSGLGEWGSGDGTWPDFLPVFPFPDGAWSRFNVAPRSGMLTAEITASAATCLVVLASGTPEATALRYLMTGRTWMGQPFFCNDESVAVTGSMITTCVPPKGRAAIIVPAPSGVPSVSWGASGARTPLGTPRITRRWNGATQRFERVAVFILKKWPFPAGVQQLQVP